MMLVTVLLNTHWSYVMYEWLYPINVFGFNHITTPWTEYCSSYSLLPVDDPEPTFGRESHGCCIGICYWSNYNGTMRDIPSSIKTTSPPWTKHRNKESFTITKCNIRFINKNMNPLTLTTLWAALLATHTTPRTRGQRKSEFSCGR